MRLDLIHYGAERMNLSIFRPIKNSSRRNKPSGGLWASPVKSGFGWADWSKANDYGDLSCFFCLSISGNVLTIDSVSDMLNLPWIDDDAISFEGLIEQGVDAIFLTEKGERETRFAHRKSLYGWDCECVLILNKDCIQVS